MPATRNDITHKPIMVDTTRRESWIAYDRMGKAHVIWADSKEEALKHAQSNDWELTSINQGDTS